MNASTPQRFTRVVIVGSLFWAAAAMVAMARSDFWLDEIWSWSYAQRLTSPSQVFTAIHLDNNHYLSTLWVWAVGRPSHWGLYRIPSVLCGIGSVAMLARIGLRRSKSEGVIAAALGGSSYLLAEYGSEARGYATAVFCSLVCLDQWRSERTQHRAWRWIVFSIAAIGGMLGHLTFLFPYAGILALEARQLWSEPAKRRKAMGRIVSFHAAPLAALAALWWIDLRFMQIGGGPSQTKARTIAQLVSLTFGGSPAWPDAALILLVAVAAALLVAGWIALGPDRAEDRLFFAVSIVIAPAAILLITRPTTFYPRYLLTCVPPFLLLLAALAARAMETPRLAKVAVVAVVAMVAGNSVRTVGFFPYGRGGYWEAYRDIQDASRGAQITVGGEYDFRDANMLAFYGPLLPAKPKLIYATADEWRSRPPDWLIFERMVGDQPPKDVIRLKNGALYRQTKAYPYRSLVSGFDWFVYQRLTPG